MLQATGKHQILLVDEHLTKSQMMEQVENFIVSDDEGERIIRDCMLRSWMHVSRDCLISNY